MMKSLKIAVCLGIVAAAAASLNACKRGSAEVRQEMKNLAGKWTWRGPGPAYTTVVELELTDNGRYTETTYAEKDGKRRLLYFNRFLADTQFGPTDDDPDKDKAIAKLEEENFKPAIEKGSYSVDVKTGATRTITFEKSDYTGVDAAEGRGVRELALSPLQDYKQVKIGARTYNRE